MPNTGSLFASLLWGSIGTGYFIYGKRQGVWAPMIGGVLMIAASYFAGSVWLLSIICVAIIIAIHVALKQGY
jgi:hypothetical protein